MTKERTIFLAILLPSLILIFGALIYTSYVATGQWNATLPNVARNISLLCPFPFGLWLALKWPGNHTVAYLLIGLCIGLIGTVAYKVILNMAYGPAVRPVPTALVTAAWMSIISTYLLLSTILFAVGGIVGDALEGRMKEEWVTPLIGLATALITALGALFGIA